MPSVRSVVVARMPAAVLCPSIENGPGPASAIVASAAIRTARYS
jgi:hypothetical protein